MIEGKGMFIHKLKSLGDIEEEASSAFDAGMTHVLIKILDGVWKYNQRSAYDASGKQIWVDDILGPAVEAFQALGIKVYGWQWVYHTTWSPAASEAVSAKDRVEKFNLDGFGIDAESSVKNKFGPAQAYADNLKVDVPVFLSTYRYPSYHREINYKAYLSVSDFVSPQVYWAGASNSGAQLLRSVGEWSGLTDKPIIPTGAAYTEHGWTAKPDEVVQFLQTAKDNGLGGANFWVWHHAKALGLWDYIAQFPWPVSEVPPPPPPPDYNVSPKFGVKLDDQQGHKWQGHVDLVG